MIQAFNYVNQKIINSKYSEVEQKKIFTDLVEKHIWGHEADKDLQVLAKINLIMHGDGWNNIYQGDTLISQNLENNFFDLILTNPPFTIKYEFADVLSNYELGLGKSSEELDILFVEKSINLLKPGGDLYIILPEGLLNNNSYQYFRDWLRKKTDLLCSISLPEGAFIPMGGSVSKTCILGIRKKGVGLSYIPPTHSFLGVAKEVGYETGKKVYKKTENSDLNVFIKDYDKVFEEIRNTKNGGEYGWIANDKLDYSRLGASHLLNIIDAVNLTHAIPLSEIINVDTPTVRINANDSYNYLEIPDISETTGVITNIRKVKGRNLNSKSLRVFQKGDILFSRINPRKNRITLAPPIDNGSVNITSNEIYILNVIPNNMHVPIEYASALIPILRSDLVKRQIERLGVGSSSSRARVYPEDLLQVRIQLPDLETIIELSKQTETIVKDIWYHSQKLINSYVEIQNKISNKIDKDDFRTI